MIDTVKCWVSIKYADYKKIKFFCDYKTSRNFSTGIIHYELSSGQVKGSFDKTINIRPEDNSYLGLSGNGYILIVEGSYHKIVKGQNAYEGFYNLHTIINGFKELIENAINIKLPDFKHWNLIRADIAKCYNLENQENVKNYINSFRLLSYPRRKLRFFENESLYISGTTSTLKIYNKLCEFNKHDLSELKKTLFNVIDYQDKIKGFIRFEIEIKKKKLESKYNKKVIKCYQVKYEELEEIWKEEFMKLYKISDIMLKKVNKKEEVKNRLFSVYKYNLAVILYNFYLSIIVDGYNSIKECMPKQTFYRKIKQLKNAGIDFSQSDLVFSEKKEIFYFNPFEFKEVA